MTDFNRVFASLALVAILGCARQSTEPTVNDESPTAWDRVSTYAENLDIESTGLGYGDVGNELAANHPPGYARCYAVWWADADISNGGFHQFFHNSTGNLVLIAIECFEHIGAEKMASIFKSALLACTQQYPQFIEFPIPDDYFQSFSPLSDDLETLSDMYYEEKYELPGKTHETTYYTDFVEHYWVTYPDEFAPQ